MQEESSRRYAGADVGPWHAPNITSDVASGIGSWSREELVGYLRSGKLPGKAQASGSMGEAVQHSFQYLTTEDLSAIATYIKSVPAVHDPADDRPRFAEGQASSTLSTLRGAYGIRIDGEAEPTGAELFQGNCASCHSAEGRGSKDGYYPSLFHNSATGARDPQNLIATILYGVNRTTAEKQAFMPGFGGKPTDANPLSDRDIVLLGNYVLGQYGRADAIITEQQVAEVRRGGPSSNLVLLARAGIAASVVVVLIVIGFFAFRRKLLPA
jgi:mono/diheme cytochrome c family protein